MKCGVFKELIKLLFLIHLKKGTETAGTWTKVSNYSAIG